MPDGTITQIQALIRQLQGALGGRAITVGTVTFTFTASATSASVTVPHKLVRVPIAVIVADWWLPGTATGSSVVRRDTLTATTFDCRGQSDSAFGAFSGSVTTGWVAIG